MRDKPRTSKEFDKANVGRPNKNKPEPEI